jgi:ZIP family zinc transporter
VPDPALLDPPAGQTASAPPPPARGGMPRWVLGAGPLVLLVALVALFLKAGPVGVFQQSFPPVEELTIERIALPRTGLMRVEVVNGGPQAVTLAQVFVDDASWVHSIDGPRTIGRLETRRIEIPYPWVAGEPHTVTLVTSTGLTFSSTVPVAVQTPRADARYLSTFALLGIYAGVVPVLIGLLWLPFLRRVERRWLDFFLALTIGLLVFLGVDALIEALETSSLVSGAFQGQALVLLGAVGTPLLLAAFGAMRPRSGGAHSPLYVATLIALGIGLHNLGEGLAIGTSYATGEIALGTFLVVGFLLHNTTEGLGIVAPLGQEQPRVAQLLGLGALAGVPTVIGAWIGGLAYSPVWTTLFFAVGAGAIAQVVIELGRLLRRRGTTLSPLNVAGVLAGMLLMYLTGVAIPT